MTKGKDGYLHKIRNIGIIAHIDAGKTTLTERILFYTRKIHRIGEVHEGTATMDYLPEEQERGITITSACTTCVWKDKQINIIDTPGHVDFTIEVERSLRVLDGAIGIFCAVGGVEPQSETVWRQSEQYKVPKLAFINKLDRLGADFEMVLTELKEKLAVNPLLLQIPEGQGQDFKGLIDLLRLKYLTFDPESQGTVVREQDLDAEQLARAQPWRERLLEQLADYDEQILEKYLADEELDYRDLRLLIRKMTVNSVGVPVLVGSALKNIGVQPVLDAVRDFLPSPLDVAPPQGMDPQDKKKKSFPVSSSAPLSALIFKVSMESGRLLTLLRVYSGSLQAGENVYISTQDKVQRVARLFLLHAGHKDRIDQAKAGQIVAAAGLKGGRTGDTLCSKQDPIILEQIETYKPVISLALEPRNASEEEKLLDALEKVLYEDPTLAMHRDKDTEQIILSGMGELHLEVVLERLRREYKVEMRSGKPQVVYRETLSGQAVVEEEFKRELGEQLHYGHVKLMVEGVGRDKDNQVLCEVDQHGLPRHWIEAVLQGIEDGLSSGVLGGYPVQGVRVLVMEMKRDPQYSSEVGYHLAAGSALKKAMGKAGPQLMEPLMKVEIYVPEEFVGDVVSLLGSKGSKIENMYDRSGSKVVQALAPLKQLFGFSTALRSSTQGRGNFVMQFERFDVLE